MNARELIQILQGLDGNTMIRAEGNSKYHENPRIVIRKAVENDEFHNGEIVKTIVLCGKSMD